MYMPASERDGQIFKHELQSSGLLKREKKKNLVVNLGAIVQHEIQAAGPKQD